METKEFKFKGTVLNGFVMLFLVLALFFASVVGIVFGIIQLDDTDGANGVWLLVGSILLLVSDIICMCSFLQLEPNDLLWHQESQSACPQPGCGAYQGE